MHLFIPGGEAAIRRPAFAAYVANLVSRGVAVYLDVTTPNALINEHVQAMVAAGRPSRDHADLDASASPAAGGLV